MPFDISKAEKSHKERMKDLQRFLSDPISAQMLEDCYVERLTETKASLNGTHTTNRKHSHTKQAKAKKSFPDYGSQTKIVRQTLAEASGRFSVGLIGDQIRDAGTNISNIAVGRVFSRLATKKELHIVEHGSGSVPNQYEKTAKFKAED